MKTVNAFINNYFWIILLALALIFFLSIAAGATWGLPALWHADERLHRVMPALDNGLESVSEIVAYPSLPFNTMFAVGKVLSFLKADDVLIMSGIRLISTVLGALVIVLTALMTLTAGKSRSAALVAAILVMVSNGFATVAHHAIVDIYLAFFVSLATFLLLLFVASQKDIWLYLGFFTIGLAATSKYNGASLLLAATLIAILFGAAHWRSKPLHLLARMFLAYFLAFIGFFIGTPRAVLNAPAYLEQLAPFLERQRVYMGPLRSIGIVGQWKNTLEGLGPLLLLLFAVAIIWGLVQAGKYVWVRIKQRKTNDYGRFYLALLLLIIAFELPIAFSRFYPIRYMVPVYPLLAVLSAWMLKDLWVSFQQSGNKVGKGIVVLATVAVIFFSALRVVSVMLYFANDSRVAAADYLLETIPSGSRTEYTFYPPELPTENRVVDNYPLVVFSSKEDIAPHTGTNMGEEGVEIRKPDYLIVDYKTYSRFKDEHLCSLNTVECQFFAKLLTEDTKYELKQRFNYRVPPYLPDVQMDFVNVEVLVFERRSEPKNQGETINWQNSLDAQFGEQILLRGYDLEQTTENHLQAILYWTTNARMAENYKVFVHCLDQDGQIVSQSDGIPANGLSPTEYWIREEIIRDEHILELPDDYSSADCRLQAGLYLPQRGERLPVLLDDQPLENGAISLENITG